MAFDWSAHENCNFWTINHFRLTCYTILIILHIQVPRTPTPLKAKSAIPKLDKSVTHFAKLNQKANQYSYNHGGCIKTWNKNKNCTFAHCRAVLHTILRLAFSITSPFLFKLFLHKAKPWKLLPFYFHRLTDEMRFPFYD